MKNPKNEGPLDFDTTDSPQEPMQRSATRRPPPVPVRVQKISGPPKHLPGANNAPYVRGVRQEATPFAPQGRRNRSITEPMPITNEDMFDVSVPGVGVYRVPASDETAAALRIDAYLKTGGDKEIGPKKFDPRMFKVTPAQGAAPTEASGAAGSLIGHQAAYEARLKEAIRQMVSEIVRKKAGGGGYVLYGPLPAERP